MKVKDLKNYLETVEDNVEITLVTFDHKTGSNEFHLNLSCSQYDSKRLRFAQGLRLPASSV